MRGMHSRPSPAIVIAILALVAGVTGAAVASPSAKKVTTKKVKKIADKEIDKKAPGLSVAHAATADSATIGQSPVAYAHVNADGSVDTANSRGVASSNVTNDPITTGSYCIRGLTGVKTAEVAADTGAFEAATVHLGPFPPPGTGRCQTPAGTQFTVSTADANLGTFPDIPFFIWFYN